MEIETLSTIEDRAPVMPATLSKRTARVVSSVASPPILTTLLILFSAMETGSLRMWQWMFMQFSTSMLVPCIYVLYLVKHGKITDIEIYQRRQRYLPNIIFLTFSLLSWVLLLIFDAPIEMIMVAAAGFLLLFVLATVNYLFKISAHVAAASIFSLILWRLMGNTLLLGLTLIPLMAWSRLTLHRHTRGQVIAGFIAGAAVFGVVYLR